jgi:ArsR family transcriptional regulator, lead/cadmium/zinc/bismuth-responsive transcriptional repressor
LREEGARITNHRFQPWHLSIGEEVEEVVRAAERTYPILTQDEQLEELALFHKALGDETRLKIVGMLLVQDVCLCEIVEGLRIPTSTINHHLKILERGGVIEGRREGKFTVYSLEKNKLDRIPFAQRADNEAVEGNQGYDHNQAHEDTQIHEDDRADDDNRPHEDNRSPEENQHRGGTVHDES